MKYKTIFLIILVVYITILSIFVRTPDLYLNLILIGFLIEYEIFKPYFSKETQEKLNIIVYILIGIFILIVFRKIHEILS
ncbi:hypothetical protein Metig_1511 [Methanotorris igneus Kol 5]|uniref:Uncharacterized protein n=1 Tax=Methanotorris igneus (strain DSM 5666 / JCM 11834 / Kol 5) TaxID=880724 RepID=F6BAV8_METIK|nr:hypothetical protein Metig_1511 [Methanotorris igneus Kol 5]